MRYKFGSVCFDQAVALLYKMQESEKGDHPFKKNFAKS